MWIRGKVKRAAARQKELGKSHGKTTPLASAEAKGKSATKVATALNVSRASVERAKKIKRDAVPEVKKAVASAPRSRRSRVALRVPGPVFPDP
jgi:hypothetical protein